MRKLLPSSPRTGLRCNPQACLRACRCYAQVNDIDRSVYFTSHPPLHNQRLPDSRFTGPDDRTLQLGRTIRTLHARLPTLLQTPLPGDILSPQISLHLFPSTHPHLPTVSGRLAYIAALWTAPVAWGRLPLVGNVRLTVLSERMVKGGTGDEKLVVKWKTCGKHSDETGGLYRGVGIGSRDPVDRIKQFISGNTSARAAAHEGAEETAFTGIFIFEFDEWGRVLKHTIEHTEGSGGEWEGLTRVVSVTDWLLGKVNRKGVGGTPELAMYERGTELGKRGGMGGMA